ncbi:excisionase family DNA binding protein [Paenibacillus phyllosphaerae]|uniref:Excisionase family DNA binding protein n=1 Tax=Paenibacillus phyllosphaerae TaxID=274593 RepID=A0A7W5FP43_9BACL|nr:helix-turn-helix domain-containing protein [Paenibacillus phyllosphaerae]MBB3111955.1 excisionase family DNA binding protein [Paenibacillus phyllosphaerae]
MNYSFEISSNQNVLTFSEAWESFFERRISKDKLYSEVRAGRIPHFRIGNKILFRRDTLVSFYAQQEMNSLNLGGYKHG